MEAESVYCEKTVFCGLSRADAENFGEFVYNLLCAFDVASGSETYADNVFAVRNKGEEGIESNDAVNFGNGNSRFVGNYLLNFERNVTVFVLDIVQNHDERSFFSRVSVADLRYVFNGVFIQMSHKPLLVKFAV